MSECVTCHRWDDEDGLWDVYYEVSTLTFVEGYCTECGTKLLPDGTTQAMVPAVTPEAVKATWLFRLLDYAAKHNPFDPEKVTHLDVFGEEMPEAYPQYDSEIWSFGDVALVHIHWGDYDEPLIVAIEGLTNDGRTIHAALQDARGLEAAQEYLRRQEELERERDLYRAALMHAGAYLWQELARLLDPDDFIETVGGECSWFLKFLRDAATDKRGWADLYLCGETRDLARAIIAQRGGEPQQPSGVRQLRPGWFLGVDKVDGIDREAWTLLRTQPDGTHKVIASGYIEQATGKDGGAR